jgi:imidazolonepropionase-like amidohydrolase
MKHRLVLTMLTLGVATSGSCGNGATEVNAAAPDPEIIRAPGTIVFTNVRVVPMTSDARLDDQTVVIRDGRVESIETSGRSPVPVDATVIEGRGRVLAPALIDMHVHLLRADLPAYLKAGIATVRNMWGHTAISSIKRDIESGTTAGPTVHSVSNGLDGSPPQWPATRLVNDPRDAEAAVQEMAATGWPALKVYQRLSAESYDSIVAAARRRNMDFMGHVPTAVTILHALESGQRSIEHLSGYDRAVTRRQGGMGTYAWADVDATRFAELVRRTVEAGTWNCPTMAIFNELSRNHSASDRAAIITNRRRFVAELQRQGARLLAGTDAGIDVVSPGASMHDELRELVAAGLTPYQALSAATKDAGEFLRVPALGTVTVGAPAELVLLDGDPLASIGNTRRIAGLTVRGTWYSASALAALGSR